MATMWAKTRGKSIQKSNRVVQCQPAKQVTLVRLIPVVVQSGQSEDCHWIAQGFIYIQDMVCMCYKTLIWQALDAPIHFLLRHPNRRRNRRSYRHAFPTNMITCIRHCNPHATHHMQSSHDSRLSHFTKCLSPSLSHPLSLFNRLIPMHNSHAAQYRSHSLNLLHSFTCDTLRLTPFDSNDSLLVQLAPDHSRYAQHLAVIHSIPDSMHSCPSCI